MTHSYIQENDIRDRYVAGRLSEEEQSSFEEHLSDCSECLGEIEMLQRFRRGLRTALTEDISHGIALQTGVWAWFMRRSRARQTVLVFGLIFLLFVPAALVYFAANLGVQDRLAQIQAALAGLQHEYSDQQKSTEELSEQLRAAQIANQSVPTQAGADLPTAGFSASLPLLTLDQVRDPDQSTPTNQIAISPFAPSTILLLELEPDPQVRFYRSKLFNKQNKLIWSASNLKLSSKDAIAIIVNNDLLKYGNYALKLEGCDKKNYCYSVATYSFRTTLPH